MYKYTVKSTIVSVPKFFSLIIKFFIVIYDKVIER